MSSEMSIERVKSIAGELVASEVTDVSFAASGSNSRVFKIRTPERDFALKFFRANGDGSNTRLASELAAGNFFREFKIGNTAELIGHSSEYNCALYNWIEGAKIESVSRFEIESALKFINSLVQIGHGPKLRDFPLGTEACISGVEVVAQINKRLVNFEKSFSKYPELGDLLEKRFKPLFVEIISKAKLTYELHSQDFNSPLPKELMILSPVDFGFHNALMKNRELVFFDFEYFGWDDPTHLIADTVLHPGMNISDDLKKYFVEAAFTFMSKKDAFFEARYLALSPLYALRWACIVMNPFRLDYQVVGIDSQSSDDHAKLRQRQLVKAEMFVKKATELLDNLESYRQNRDARN